MGSVTGNVTTPNVIFPMMTRGDTYEHLLPFTNDDGTAYDFTWCTGAGISLECEMRVGGPDGTSIGAVAVSIDGLPTAGVLRVTVQSSVSVNAVPGYLYYDIQRKDTNPPTKRSTIVSGRMRVLADVTKA